MKESILDFYNNFAYEYHLIFKDWKKSVKYHANNIDKVIKKYISTPNKDISLLDCSCGIGTQAIGLGLLGYNVHATDLSSKAIERARKEAKSFNAQLTFQVADFRTLDKQITGTFDVVISFDNALPHLLTDDDLLLGLKNIWNKLNNNGMLVASIRNYNQLVIDRPKLMSNRINDYKDERRIIFQVWDWEKCSNIYTINQFIVRGKDNNWNTTHRATTYRAYTIDEFTKFLEMIGFSKIEWHQIEDTGYHQPIVTAHKVK